MGTRTEPERGAGLGGVLPGVWKEPWPCSGVLRLKFKLDMAS